MDHARDALDSPVARARLSNRRILLLSGLAAAVPGGCLLLSGERPGEVKAALTALMGLLVVIRSVWFLRSFDRPGRAGPGRGAQVALLCPAVALAVTGSGGEYTMLWALLPGSVLSASLILGPASGAGPAAWLTAGAAGALFAGALLGPAGLSADRALREAALGAAVMVSVMLLEQAQTRNWSLVSRLHSSRAIAAELAVAQERLRFAADLHDIQGHHLEAIAIKSELIARLAGRDARRAALEAQEVASIARSALADTREVVSGYRSISFSRELTNAIAVLRAADITTRWEGDLQKVPPAARSLFGRMLREATTNILRHSRARHCIVVLCAEPDTVTLTVRNDGVVDPPDATDPGTGIKGLEERFARHRGAVRARCADGWFELMGRVPIA
ncbi:histidine kinase [Streptomyces sp. PRKS01-65]|nr:histidine kinase [Streptomyces harenosi]NEY35464.1 histidine kinase [Streptomyces harenosi]